MVMFISRLLILVIPCIRFGVFILSFEGQSRFLPSLRFCSNVHETTMCSMSKFETPPPQIPSVDKQREALDGMSAHLRGRLEEMQRLQERQALSMKENKFRAEAALRGELPAAKAVQPAVEPVQEVVDVEAEQSSPSPGPPPPSIPGVSKSVLPPVKVPPSPVQFAAKPTADIPPVRAASPSPAWGERNGGFMPRPPLAKPGGQDDELKVTPFVAGATFIIAFFIFFLLIYALSK